MSVRCGHCSGQHDSVNEVRICSQGGIAKMVEAPRPLRRPTPAQVNYIKDLRTQLGLVPVPPEAAQPKDSDTASSMIELLKEELATRIAANPAPTAIAPTALPKVADGYYAVDTDGKISFYHVNSPTEGRWAGYTFVDVQAGSDFIKLPSQRVRNAVIAKIAVDPKEASLRYGREIGRCGVCGRTLTNQDSRDRGIGPVCADKMGW